MDLQNSDLRVVRTVDGCTWLALKTNGGFSSPFRVGVVEMNGELRIMFSNEYLLPGLVTDVSAPAIRDLHVMAVALPTKELIDEYMSVIKQIARETNEEESTTLPGAG